MEKPELSVVERLILEGLKDGPQKSTDLLVIVRDKLTEMKGGNNPAGATARSQGVLNELDKAGFIVKIGGSFFGAKTYDLTDKGKQAIS